jgi:hypothetical protein
VGGILAQVWVFFFLFLSFCRIVCPFIYTRTVVVAQREMCWPVNNFAHARHDRAHEREKRLFPRALLSRKRNKRKKKEKKKKKKSC